MSVFISGASSGIGKACAEAFAKAKQDLVLVARRMDRIQDLCENLQTQYGIRAHGFCLDIQDLNAVEDLIQNNRAIFQNLHILVNNAGLAKGLSPLQDGNPRDWDSVIDTNIKGVLYLTRSFLPFLIQNKGHIVNIGSVAGHWVYEKGTVYCATKFAVRAINNGLRLDLNGTGVRVTEISPGMVETEFSDVRFFGNQEQARAVYQGRTPLKPEDIAETVVWCAQRPPHVNIQEVIIFPTEQAGVGVPFKNK